MVVILHRYFKKHFFFRKISIYQDKKKFKFVYSRFRILYADIVEIESTLYQVIPHDEYDSC